MAPPESTSQPHDTAADFDDTPPPRQGFSVFARDIGILAVLIGIGLWAYNGYVETQVEVDKLADEAKRYSKENDLASLMKAEKKFKEALEKKADGRVEAALAEVYLMQHSVHGLDTLDKASQHLSVAVSKNIETPTRYAVAAYLKIEKGQPERAEAMINELLHEGKGAPSLAHALGWAKMEQGNLYRGGQALQQASDQDFSSVAYLLTLAENSHRDGNARAAIKRLSDIVRDSLNPDHNFAKVYLAAMRLKTYGNITTPSKLIEEFEASEAEKGPRTQAFAEWARAEFFLAIGSPDKSLEHIQKAKAMLADYSPFLGTEARALVAQGKEEDGIAIYEKAIATTPLYRGLKWDLAKLKSQRGDDAALTLVDELEKAKQGLKGPEYLIFKGQHALAKGDLETAKARFTEAADVGDNPEILLGLAKVAFQEEIKRGKKADLEKVAEPLQMALDGKKYFPEAKEFYGDVNLWNFLVDGADAAYKEAEDHMKRLKRPIPEVLSFYDRVIGSFSKTKSGPIRRKAKQLAKAWQEKRQAYIASLSSAG